MKKKTISKLLAFGVSSVACMYSPAQVSADAAPQTMTTDMPMSADEQAFANKMNDGAKQMFMKMYSQERKMAMQIVNHDCKGKNSCKGQSGCKTDDHSCKGKNSCKGKGACAVKPDDAVKMTSDKMIEKRMSLLE